MGFKLKVNEKETIRPTETESETLGLETNVVVYKEHQSTLKRQEKAPVLKHYLANC